MSEARAIQLTMFGWEEKLAALRSAGTNPMLAWLLEMDALRQAFAA